MATHSIKLATGPVTWGVDFADTPTNPPWEQVLDEIAASGVGALELGPVGYLPEDPAALHDALASRGLAAVGSFVFEDLHDPTATAAIVATAERACRAIAAARGAVLVIIDRPSEERAATAGRSQAARRLSPAEWEAMLATIRRVADVARAHGLRPAVHPHAGGYLEFEDEIERLLDDAEADLELCLDTGHVAYAGADPAAALARFAPRLAHVHLKDVDGAALARVRDEGLGFWQAIAAGIFCPLGQGVVDLDAVLAELQRQGYDGFATIEQDRVPGSGAPLDDLRESLRVVAASEPAATLAPAARRVLELVGSWPAIDDMTVEQARALEVRRRRELGGPPVDVGEVRDVQIAAGEATIPARLYRPLGGEPIGTLVWLHGGGWVLGSPELSDDQNRELVNATGCVVVAVDYRLAPEHPFPAGLHDAFDALSWAARHDAELGGTGRLAVGGDSAGGNLAAAVTMMARDRGGPQADFQLLIYPATCRSLDAPSRRRYAEGHWITAADLEWFWGRYLARAQDARDPYASPLLAESLAGLPPAYVLVAECDVLRDEGVRYAERLREHGVPVELREQPGMLHGFLACGGVVGETAREAWAAAGGAVRRALAPEPVTPTGARSR